MKHIVVIGAGLSGTLLMINLFRQNSSVPIRISWIDRNDEKELGPAYSTNEDYLHNVPVERRRFLRHLFRYWEIIRSRIPPENGEIIRKSIESGQLRILKAKLYASMQGRIRWRLFTLTGKQKKCKKKRPIISLTAKVQTWIMIP